MQTHPTSPIDVAVERALVPLDLARRFVFVTLGAWGRRLAVDRSQRLSQLGVLVIALVLGLSLLVPWWLLAWGPIVLGVPHLVADLRYLVVRPRLHRRPWVLGALALACALAASGQLVVASSFALLAGLVVARAPIGWKKRVGVMVVPVAVLLSSLDSAPLVLAHGHNLVAVAVLVAWSPGPKRWWPGLCATLVAGLVALSLDAAWRPLPDSLEPFARSLAPGVSGPLATFAVTSFAFLQAVHYATWLRLLPDLARPRETPRTFRRSWSALREELGWLPVLGLALGVGFFTFGLVDVLRADTAYFRLALFHGPLELFALALAATERRWLSVDGNASFQGVRDTPRPS